MARVAKLVDAYDLKSYPNGCWFEASHEHMTNLFYLRRAKFFSKGRYSRSRQLSRVIFYFALYINVLIIYGVFYFIYGLSIYHSWSWWLYGTFLLTLGGGFFARQLKSMPTQYSSFFKYLRTCKSGFYFDYVIKNFFFFVGRVLLTKLSLMFSEKFFVEYCVIKQKKFLVSLQKLTRGWPTDNIFFLFLYAGFIFFAILILVKVSLQSIFQTPNFLTPHIGVFLAANTILACIFNQSITRQSSVFKIFILKYTQLILLTVVLYNLWIFVSLPAGAVFGPSLRTSLIILAAITSIFGTLMLSEKSIQSHGSQPLVILVFTWATILMTSTENLLTMFLAFELMFFPSAYYVYYVSYTKPSSKSLGYLALWTYAGSFLCLLGIAYLFSRVGTLSVATIELRQLSRLESIALTWVFVLGFGIKVPLWPFYYWLIKVHVDAPTGFSIFLSGFLVKTALYCLLQFLVLFPSQATKTYLLVWLLYGIIDASMRMWETVDIKKLVALATVQEMNLLCLLAIVYQNGGGNIVACFVILHGVISALFFLVVDISYKIAGSRQTTSISGLSELAPKFVSVVWIALLAFRGLPLFAKFFVESDLLIILINTCTTTSAVLFLVATFIGVVSFFRAWFSVLYGTLKSKHQHSKLLHTYVYIAVSATLLLTSILAVINIFYVPVAVNQQNLICAT